MPEPPGQVSPKGFGKKWNSNSREVAFGVSPTPLLQHTKALLICISVGVGLGKLGKLYSHPLIFDQHNSEPMVELLPQNPPTQQESPERGLLSRGLVLSPWTQLAGVACLCWLGSTARAELSE